DDGAAFPDLVHGVAHVLLRDLVDVGRVLDRARTGGNHGRTDLAQERRQIAEVHAFDRTLDRAAVRVPDDGDQVNAGGFDRIFEAPEEIRVDDVAGRANTEDVAEALNEHDLNRRPGIHAAHDGGDGILPRRGRLHVGREVAHLRLSDDEARVALSQE